MNGSLCGLFLDPGKEMDNLAYQKAVFLSIYLLQYQTKMSSTIHFMTYCQK